MGRVFDGSCRLCGETYTGTGISSHVKGCLTEHADIAAVHHGLLVGARADGAAGRFWLYAIVEPEATLADLDLYFRNRWFEDEPEVESAFVIEETHYLSAIPDELEEGRDVEAMGVDVGAVLRPRMECTYLFDPRRPTEVELRVFDPYPHPEQLSADDSEETIATVARNDDPDWTCSTCDSTATHVCVTCADRDEPELGPFACDDCTDLHDGPLEPLANTPRAGGHSDPLDEPDVEDET